MGEIILSNIGSAVGSAALPNGVNLAGSQISGAFIGSAIGGLAGRAIDAALAPTVEGPRLKALHVMESREGAGIANVYGRMRVGGQLIWASRFKEKRRERSAGKGGPKVADYSYSVSLAVAIAEGPISRIDRVWANGDTLALGELNWRLYKGDESQLADPLIEAIEGTGNAPAFRGTAYMVFEDLPLEAFGNRLPQLSFEVVRTGNSQGDLRTQVRGVNIIPASGEFVYASQIVRERRFPGIERPLNMNNGQGVADFALSLEQLSNDLPEARSVALTVGWFGDDLRAGQCKIRPGIETRDRETVPYSWEVAGKSRDAAYLVSQGDGGANYGGTPADRCVIEGIQALKAQGASVTLSPFLLMDVPEGNGLPDPYGESEQAAFPWRGRITVTADGTSDARDEIEAFLGTDHDFGFRHFILHHARLAVEAGGVDAILIGSEMVSLTRTRDDTGAFPFVDGLVQLANDVKAIVGSETDVSYAADWTEYGAYVPGDGSGDVFFPLDPLWASTDVDFVGIDWYAPAGDWRDGEDHLDAVSGYIGADSPEYLTSQMSGGEAYDWYYADSAARDAQIRTPIEDTAHGEDWIFRQKDIAGWWGTDHHERPAGVRSASPTSWMSGMKPVRFMEIGFPAVDKGGNAPNLFYDPKSAESALPPYSSGERDDVFQRKALETALEYWQAQPFIDEAFVWAWDGRPWPDFPAREDVWSDGPNWAYGHWLNGRTGLISVSEVIQDMCERAGVSADSSAVPGALNGYVLEGAMPLRRALEPLRGVYGFMARERESGLVFAVEGGEPAIAIDTGRVAEPGASKTSNLLDKRPGRLNLSFVRADGAYSPGHVDARTDDGDADYSISAALPLLLTESEASTLALALLNAALDSDVTSVSLPPEYIAIEPGDLICGGGLQGDWLVGDVVEDGLLRQLSLTRPVSALRTRAISVPEATGPATVFAEPELVLIDGPPIAGLSGTGPIIAASADPWQGGLKVSAGLNATGLIERAVLAGPSRIGRLVNDFGPGPVGRWDRGNAMTIDLDNGDLSSADEISVLGGANLLLIDGLEGWELAAFSDAEMETATQWRLTGLLRGLNGSPAVGALAGAVCIVVDVALSASTLADAELGLELNWQAGAGALQGFTHQDRAHLPWPVAHLEAVATSDGWQLGWIPRGMHIPDNLDAPDPVKLRMYRVQAELDNVIVTEMDVSQASCFLTGEHDLVRVAEIGADGRRGAWVSIALGAS
ncbi:glycoside hydrolase/phage tail family protein [Henriciella sp. AS95]|uniref:baseplate multidomain protein megatron n=1 Tax=Henriciella sp. AS95 TaxID=3135782 RepID=UPI0031827151